MANSLQTIENGLHHLEPRFAKVLAETLPVERLIQTTMIALERQDFIVKSCPMESIFSAAMSAAVIGLEPDGVLGQGAIIPFKTRGGTKCQFIPMVQGYCTLADRARRTLTGHVVFRKDRFEFDEAHGRVTHVWNDLERTDANEVKFVYSISRAPGRSDIVKVMTVPQVLSVRNMSASYRNNPRTSTWTTNPLPMFEKTGMRMNAKRVPVVPLFIANAVDTQVDLGHHATLRDDSNIVIDGESTRMFDNGHTPSAPSTADVERHVYELRRMDGSTRRFGNAQRFVEAFVYVLEKNSGKAGLVDFYRANEETVGVLPEEERATVEEAYFMHKPGDQ